MKTYLWRMDEDLENDWATQKANSKIELAGELVWGVYDGEPVKQTYFIADHDETNEEKFNMEIRVSVQRNN